jgi:diguanylate cyclase (GGDEF)-like protein
MERLITLPKKGRRRRICSGSVFFLLWLVLGIAHAASAPLDGAWREVRADDTPQAVLDEYHAGLLKRFDPSRLQHFSQTRLGTWIVIAPQPPWDNTERVLSIHPASLAKFIVYADDQTQSLTMDDFNSALQGHGRLAWRVPATQRASAPILLKLAASLTPVAPVSFQLLPLTSYLQEDSQWLAFATACLAVMLAMVFMTLCFAVMLRDVTYAWYAGYILCYSLIQGVRTGFVFHPLEWTWMSGLGPVIGTSAIALSVAFASLFMVRFCELRRHAPLLRVPVMSLAVGMIQIVLMRCSHIPLLIDVAQLLLNPALMLGAVLLLIATIVAGIRGSRQAWFFLAGWAPLLVLTALTSAQADGAFSEWWWLNDASLAGGAFEAIVLSFGLADRTLRLRNDRDVVRRLADHDALTNVLNRRAWTERAGALLTAGPPRPISVLFLDLDHFKLLNDRQGHQSGDRALVAVANALAAELRPGDLLSRYGGEEFVALLDGTVALQATQVATRLCRRIHRLEIPVDAESQLLSVSIGIAMRVDGDDVQSLVDRADKAMYEAKLNGRNRVCMHDPARTRAVPGKRLHAVDKRESDH